MHVPDWVRDREGKLYRAEEEHRSTYGRKPTVDELAEAVGISPGLVTQSHQAVKTASVWSSLDEPIDAEDERSRSADSLPDSLAESAAQRVEDAIDAEKMLVELGERDARVLRERYGIGREDGEAQTLREMGRQLGVSRARVSQIEARALRVLRHALREERVRPSDRHEGTAWSSKR